MDDEDMLREGDDFLDEEALGMPTVSLSQDLVK